MKDVFKLVVLLVILAGTILINTKYNDWYYKSKILPVIKEQSSINNDLNLKLKKLEETVEYLDFSLEVNNKLLEEIILEQIKSN